MSLLPLFSFPTTVMIVDDDPILVETLKEFLQTDYNIKNFNTPQRAAEYFKTYQPMLPALKVLHGCPSNESYDISGHLPVDIDFTVAKSLRNNTQRFSELSVLIVDYNMPGMNGLELCKQLSDVPIKKILLTGNSDTQLAIDGFNNGLIDCFIQKGNPNLPKDLRYYLKTLTQKYLADNTQQLSRYLETDYQLPISDPIFINFFKEMCTAYSIAEYFVIDEKGNFVLVDNNKETYYLTVQTDRTLKNFVEIYSDNVQARDLINAVKNAEAIPFFGENIESWEVDLSEWPKYFYAPQVLQGREIYYWAMIKIASPEM